MPKCLEKNVATRGCCPNGQRDGEAVARTAYWNHRKKFIQEELQWFVTFRQTIIPESHLPCEPFAFLMGLKREFSLLSTVSYLLACAPGTVIFGFITLSIYPTFTLLSSQYTLNLSHNLVAPEYFINQSSQEHVLNTFWHVYCVIKWWPQIKERVAF